MAGADGLKSRLELAMERFRLEDEAAGGDRAPITEARKAAIAEVRNLYEAKLAEMDILHQGKLRMPLDPEIYHAIDAEYRSERARLASERDAKIEQARKADPE